jgi:tRNA (cytidine32/guanosine34-2'-O)-methyltransferase
MYDPFSESSFNAAIQHSDMNRIIVPFVACGDLSGFDSDMTYPQEVLE